MSRPCLSLSSLTGHVCGVDDAWLRATRAAVNISAAFIDRKENSEFSVTTGEEVAVGRIPNRSPHGAPVMH
ncbi:hypothetical protein F2P81_011125 [Scophthalmus maximus]|uniref:Uncharacterized protein n=1 Tax=Scophthalmus maximus TaxID=52904 RepID=A0A6A4SPA6_SCOMX|nr:hypothetical protein F2P81_011125 [Scophthalmus maximus]